MSASHSPAPAVAGAASPVLFVAISGHGYGHAAQTAPVVAALRRLRPDLRVWIHSNAEERVLRDFYPDMVGYSRPNGDFGLAMRDAFDVDADESARRYAALHADYDALVAEEERAIRAAGAALVLANIPYQTLAAAKRAGVPSVGFSSLNWLGIYDAFCGDRPEAARIKAEIAAGYRSADLFLLPTPAMPAPEFAPRTVGLIARKGTRRRAEIDARFGLAVGERLALVSLGGVATALPLADWPALPGWRYVIAGGVVPPRADMIPLAAAGMDHLDMLASVDAVVTKPGYGTIAEAAHNGAPTLFAPRLNWPEEPPLVAWLRDHCVTEEISRAQLLTGDLASALERATTRPKPPIPAADGAEQAAALIAGLLPSSAESFVS